MLMLPFSKSARFAILLAAFVVAPACTNEDEIFNPDISNTNFAAALGVDLAASTQTSSGLFYRDMPAGTGATVPATGTTTRVTVQYTGWLRNGVEFDDGTLTFFVGTGAVQPGFDEGMRGMRVGGIRQLIIPPELLYGQDGATGIPGQSITVFSVTLLSIG